MGRLIAILVVLFSVIALVVVVNRESPDDRSSQESQLSLEQRFELNPDDDELRIRLAESLASTNAPRSFELLTGIEADSERAFDAARGAYLVARQHLPEQLESAVQRLGEVGEGQLGACLTVAEHYFNSGQAQKALDFALRATELDANRKESWLLLADVYDAISQPASAVQPLRKAIQLDPDEFAAHANLAHSLFAAGQKAEAEKEVEWCLSRQPSNHHVLRILADIQRSEGEIDGAMKTIQLAIDADPDDLRCLVLQADLFIYQRDGEKAYAILSPLRGTHETNRPFLSTLARAAAMSGRRKEARQIQQLIADQIREEEQHEKFQ